MKDNNIESPPFVPLFLLFVTYGGWLIVLLTKLFWVWSGMATLGIAYLILTAFLAAALRAGGAATHGAMALKFFDQE